MLVRYFLRQKRKVWLTLVYHIIGTESKIKIILGQFQLLKKTLQKNVSFNEKRKY